METENTDVKTLVELNNSLSTSQPTQLAEAAKIKDPVQEIEGALTGFLSNKLEKLSQEDDFQDLVKMHIRQRLSEASFAELMQLHHSIAQDNTKATETALSLFKYDGSEKTFIDSLRESGVNSKAKDLYESTDSKDILQAVQYLGQILNKAQLKSDLKDAKN